MEGKTGADFRLSEFDQDGGKRRVLIAEQMAN
jgi:hypothetical protein